MLQIDNTTAVSYIQRQGGTSRISDTYTPYGHSATWWIFKPLIFQLHRTSWRISSVASSSIHTNGPRNHQVLLHICNQFGTPDLDLMATPLNNKFSCFLSRVSFPTAIAVDILLSPWKANLIYVFPPLPVIFKPFLRILRYKEK